MAQMPWPWHKCRDHGTNAATMAQMPRSWHKCRDHSTNAATMAQIPAKVWNITLVSSQNSSPKILTEKAQTSERNSCTTSVHCWHHFDLLWHKMRVSVAPGVDFDREISIENSYLLKLNNKNTSNLKSLLRGNAEAQDMHLLSTEASL